SHFLSLELLCRGTADRCLDFHILKFQISGSLIAHEHGNLPDDLTKFPCSHFFSPDHADFMLDQPVIHHDYSCHPLIPPLSWKSFSCGAPPRKTAYSETYPQS